VTGPGSDGGLNPVDCTRWGQSCGGAIRVGDYKLIVGYPGDNRALPLPATAEGWAELYVAEKEQAGLAPGQSGGGPGLDGCNYTTGYRCPCHHLNGGPCLFDVVQDPSEKVNLANSSEHKAVFAQLTARFKAVSATNAPQAGLVGDALTQDTVLQCNKTLARKYFEPFGPDLPWPYPA